MPFDFDKVTDRRYSNSVKWDVKDGELPMWIADMDFPAAPPIINALKKRVEHGVFGYATIPDKWYDAIISRWTRAHGYAPEKENISFCTGVVPAISSIVKRVTNIGDNVLVQTPVYDIFFHSIENAGRHVLENRLRYDGKEYSPDMRDLEEKLKNPLTTLMILCNPHNPTGRIQSKDELAEIGRLCKKYGVTVISDEIHCDITDTGAEYTPFLSVSDDCKEVGIMCASSSKAFNIAGLQGAFVCRENQALKNNVFRGLNSDELAEPNCFVIDAMVAAFTECDDWLLGFKKYVEENKRLAFSALSGTPIVYNPQKATYLMWLDCSAIVYNTDVLEDFLREKTGLFLTAGGVYRGNGSMFLRLNAACPRSVLEDGLNRLKAGVEMFMTDCKKARPVMRKIIG